MNTFKFIIIILISSVGAIDHEEILDALGLEHFDKHQPGCPKIHDLHPIMNMKTLFGEWRVPFMSSTWMRGLAQSMHQTSIKKYTGLEKACVKLSLVPMPLKKDGRSNSSILIYSKCPKTGMMYKLACDPSNDMNSEWFCGNGGADRLEAANKSELRPDGYYVYIFQYDFAGGNRYALAVKCFPKLGMNWAIVTKEKVVDPKIIKRLLVKVQAMGFEVENVIELANDKC